MESEKMVIREMILRVNLFWDLCMQTIENIPTNPEHVDNVPKRSENPDCNVQKVYPKFRHVPVWLSRGVTPPPPPEPKHFRVIQCKDCSQYFHVKCSNINKTIFNSLMLGTKGWNCTHCVKHNSCQQSDTV